MQRIEDAKWPDEFGLADLFSGEPQYGPEIGEGLNLKADELFARNEYSDSNRIAEMIEGVIDVESDEKFAVIDQIQRIEEKDTYWTTYNYEDFEPKIGEGKVKPSESKYLRRNKNSGKQKFGPPPKRC